MTDKNPQVESSTSQPTGKPKRSRLGQILAEKPEARPRLRTAVVSLLGTALATIVIVGLLLIWHLRRRAQLIRDRLAAPRQVSLPGVLEDLNDSLRPPSAGA